MEYCNKIIKGTLCNIPISPEMKNVIEQKINPIVEDLATDMDEFYRFLKEEILEDLKYFNSLEKEIESFKSQLELQRTQFSNEINRHLREYYYVDHMNAILGVYTKLDEFNGLQYLKAQLQDKDIAISALKKLNEKMKGKSMETKTKEPIDVPISIREPKRTVNQSVATPQKKTVASESTI
ncbi:hypothetical protein Tco_0222457 [Tanacetum coccineum]